MKWYYLDGQKSVGPLAETSILELKACGMISDETQIRQESSDSWVRFDQTFGKESQSNDNSQGKDRDNSIKFHCSHCQQKISAEPGQENQFVQCPACGADLVIPTTSDQAATGAPPPLRSTEDVSTGELHVEQEGQPGPAGVPGTAQPPAGGSAAMKSYYVIRNGDQSGPYSIVEITDKITAGGLSNDDLCWTQGMSGWESLQKTLSLGANTPPPPPPNPRSIPTGPSVAGQPAHPVTSSAPNRRPIKWIPALVAFCFMALFMCFVDFSLLGNEQDFAVMWALAGLPVTIIAVTLLGMLHYKCWNSLPPQFRATTPAKAVGFMFIPFYNFYWGFTSWPKLSEGLMNWQRSAGVNPTNTKGLGITFAILFICHCIIELISAPALGVMIKIAIVVIFILYYLKLVRGFNQMLNASPTLPDPLPSGFWNFKKTAISLAVALPIYWVILGVTYNPVAAPSSSSSEESLPSWYTEVQGMKTLPCPSCRGNGVDPVPVHCFKCSGTGTVTTVKGFEIVCPSCGGTGKKTTSCRGCGGSGQVKR